MPWAGNDVIYGEAGNDTVRGNTGSDRFYGGDDSDLFIWIAGDGSDVIEGGAGSSDELQFIAKASANRMEVFGGGDVRPDVC